MLSSLPLVLPNLISPSPESAPWITTVISVSVGEGSGIVGMAREVMISGWYTHFYQWFQPAGALLLPSVFVRLVKLLFRYWQKFFTIQDGLWEVSTWVCFCFLSKACVCSPALKGIGDSTGQMECVRKDYWFIYACFQHIWRSWFYCSLQWG